MHIFHEAAIADRKSILEDNVVVELHVLTKANLSKVSISTLTSLPLPDVSLNINLDIGHASDWSKFVIVSPVPSMLPILIVTVNIVVET